jgi:hypothetical protein
MTAQKISTEILGLERRHPWLEEKVAMKCIAP